MKIAVIDTTIGGAAGGAAADFLPRFLKGLAAKGHEMHLLVGDAPDDEIRRFEESNAVVHAGVWNAAGFIEETTPVLAAWLDRLSPDVYLISASDDVGWTVLPLIDPRIATVAIGHRDDEAFYLPARHYRALLTRVVGVSPEVCVGYVLSCVIDKERVEWIPYGVPVADAEPSETGAGALKSVSAGADQTADGGRFDGAEVFISAAPVEGFSYTLAAAMGAGCCPVVAAGTIVNDLVEDGVNGFLIEHGDPEKFAEKLEFLAADRVELLKMRRRAWTTARAYGLPKMLENYENCFAKAIEDAALTKRETYADYPLPETSRSRLPLWLRKLKRKLLDS